MAPYPIERLVLELRWHRQMRRRLVIDSVPFSPLLPLVSSTEDMASMSICAAGAAARRGWAPGRFPHAKQGRRPRRRWPRSERTRVAGVGAPRTSPARRSRLAIAESNRTSASCQMPSDAFSAGILARAGTQPVADRFGDLYFFNFKKMLERKGCGE
eukprot:scaffold18531_cov85-Isochrysis_galbana.AAC.1